MGCGSSTLSGGAGAAAPAKGATESMIAGMTVGELKDYACPHNARINAALEAAKEEIEGARGRSVWDDYEADTELIGRGAFARVFRALRRDDQTPVAIKVIGRETKAFAQQRRAMTTKVATMRTLQGHNNMLRLYEVFEDGEGFHVVVEFCKGAALLEQIHDRGCFSERDAAHVMRQLLEFLAYAHDDCNVVHRDIKPENLLLLDPDAPQCAAAGLDGGDGVGSMLLKVIDFGTAGFCEPGQHLHSKVGTARYVAPEVLNKDYDRSSDIWSAGVVMYILLCGHPPFKGSTETGTLKQVKAGNYKLDDDVWASVHDSAKDMMAHMMVVDPSQRWTAAQLLKHPWFEEVLAAPDRPLAQQPGYLERLGAFTGAARVRRLALKLMVAAAAAAPGVVNITELGKLRSLFVEMDLDGDGIISAAQLQAGLASLGTHLSERDLAEFMHVSKVDCHSEGINFTEFIAAMIDSQDLANKQAAALIEREFDELDMDHDGFITPEDLVAASRAGVVASPGRTPLLSPRTTSPGGGAADALAGDEVATVMHEVVHEVLGSELTLAEAAEMLDEVDEKHVGKINLQEFTEMVIGRSKSGRHSVDLERAPAAGGAPLAFGPRSGSASGAAAGDAPAAKAGAESGGRRGAPEDTALATHAHLKAPARSSRRAGAGAFGGAAMAGTKDIDWDHLDKRKFFLVGVGLFSGVTCTLYPLSVVKTRQMAAHGAVGAGLGGTRDVAALIWRAEGMRGFYRGFGTVLFGTIPGRTIYMSSLEMAKAATHRLGEQLDIAPSALAGVSSFVGGAAGSLSTQAVVVPIDVVSQRLMVQGGALGGAAAARGGGTPAQPSGSGGGGGAAGPRQQPLAAAPPTPPGQQTRQLSSRSGGGGGSSSSSSSSRHRLGPRRRGAAALGGAARGLASAAGGAPAMNGLAMARLIVHQEGIGGLYRGFWPSVATFVPSNAIWWGAYGFWRHVGEQLVTSLGAGSGGAQGGAGAAPLVGIQVAAGVLSGCTSALLTNPLDLVKTRLQVVEPVDGRVPRWGAVLRELLAEEGPRGLLRGVAPRMASSALWGTAMVTTGARLRSSRRRLSPLAAAGEQQARQQQAHGAGGAPATRRRLLAAAGLLAAPAAGLALVAPRRAAGAPRRSLQADARLAPLQSFWARLVAELQEQLSPDFSPALVAYGPAELLPSGAPGDPALEYRKRRVACGAFTPGFQQPYALCPLVPGGAPASDAARACCRHFAYAVPRSRFALAALDRQSSVVVSPRLALAAPATWQGVLVHECGHCIDFHVFAERYRLPPGPAPRSAAAAAALAAIDAEESDAELRADRMANALLADLLGRKLCYSTATSVQALVPPDAACASEAEAEALRLGGGAPPEFVRHFPHAPVSA
ncbi:CPK12 [Scenedesmus sp. PABB004]|nr:CPK12 [Scenedesmus sp. PABB004]